MEFKWILNNLFFKKYTMKKLFFIFLLFFTTISQIQAFNSFNLEVSQRFWEMSEKLTFSFDNRFMKHWNKQTFFFINENDYFIFSNDFSK